MSDYIHNHRLFEQDNFFIKEVSWIVQVLDDWAKNKLEIE
jgi:hypothetical protein